MEEGGGIPLGGEERCNTLVNTNRDGGVHNVGGKGR